MPSIVPDRLDIITEVLHIAVGVIQNNHGEILLSQRHQHVHQGGLWEFPGGKREPGETIEEALSRELYEELGLSVKVSVPLIKLRHDYADKSVLLDVFEINDWTGEPSGQEGQPVKWVPRQMLRNYEFPAADVPIIRAIELPKLCFITPEPEEGDDSYLQTISKVLDTGISLLQVRLKQCGPERAQTLLNGIEQLCEQRACQVVVNADTPVDHQRHVHDMHLPSRQLMLNDNKQFVGRMLSASCHTEQEVEQANRAGIDFIFIAPVLSTQSHPGVVPLGWDGFEQLSEAATMPVYALGGQSLMHLLQARKAGAQGIAMVSSLWKLV